MATMERGTPQHILHLSQAQGFSKPNLRFIVQPGWEGWWGPAVTLSPPAGGSACLSVQVYPSPSSQLHPSVAFPLQPYFPEPHCALLSQPQVPQVHFPTCCLITDLTAVLHVFRNLTQRAHRKKPVKVCPTQNCIQLIPSRWLKFKS